MAANPELQQQVDALKYFLSSAPGNWEPSQSIRRFLLPSGEYISCVLWKNLFHVTGTDIMRALMFRFQAFGRPIKNLKKFEEGVFSDLRNLKAGIDASLEEPRSEFLEMLYKNSCIRTQKKQKVFYWFSVPHDRLFVDALERDLKREALGHEPTTVAVSAQEASVGLLPSSLVSSAHRTSTQYTPQQATIAPSPHRTSTQFTPQIEPQVPAPTYDTSMMNVDFVNSPLSMHATPVEPILAMDDWIADDAPLAPNVNMNAQGTQLNLSASWDDGFIFNSPSYHPLSGLDSTSGSFQSESLIRPSFSDGSFGRDRSSSNSSLSSLMNLDQGYGSFDDTSKLLLQQLATRSEQHTFDPAANVAPSNLSQKPVGGHTRAHSFSHNLAAAATASPNPLFGMYSMFDGSPNYQHRRKSSLLSNGTGNNGMGHRRSVSSVSAMLTADFNAHEYALPPPSADGGNRADRRIFNCSFDHCGRKFKRYEHLKRHHRTHTKERPYICIFQGCDKSFSRSDNLAAHIRVHQKFPNGTIPTSNSSISSIAESVSDCSSERSEISESSLPNSPTEPMILNMMMESGGGKGFAYQESPMTSPQLDCFDQHAEHDAKHMEYLFDSTFGLDPTMPRREQVPYFGA